MTFSDLSYPSATTFANINEKCPKKLICFRPNGDKRASSSSSDEMDYSLSKLPQNVTHEQLTELDKFYHLTGMQDQVIASHWYKIIIERKYSEANPELCKYLITVGRRYLIAPLYNKLLTTEEGKLFAQKVH